MPTPAKYAVGDQLKQAWNPVSVIRTRHSSKMGHEYLVQRLVPEPVGYNRDSSIMVSSGLPFWCQEWLLQPMPTPDSDR